MLMMVLCDREGRVYDVWITFGSVHEVRAFRERKKRSLWFWGLVENCVVFGDRGFRGCEGVIVCDSNDMRAKRQVVEGVISQIKLFNAGSGWWTLTCVRVYVYAYASKSYPHIINSPLPITKHHHQHTISNLLKLHYLPIVSPYSSHLYTLLHNQYKSSYISPITY